MKENNGEKAYGRLVSAKDRLNSGWKSLGENKLAMKRLCNIFAVVSGILALYAGFLFFRSIL